MKRLDFIEEALYNSDANTLGELFRDIIFVEDGGKGTNRNLEFIPAAFEYNDLGIKADFWKQLTGKIYSTQNDSDDDSFIEDAKQTTLVALVFGDNLMVHAGWFWDGDMYLGIRIEPAVGNVIYLLNADAKKDYTWKDATSGSEDEDTFSQKLYQVLLSESETEELFKDERFLQSLEEMKQGIRA